MILIIVYVLLVISGVTLPTNVSDHGKQHALFQLLLLPLQHNYLIIYSRLTVSHNEQQRGATLPFGDGVILFVVSYQSLFQIVTCYRRSMGNIM